MFVFEPAHDKTYNKTCDQRRLRSACASAQSDQSLRWSHVPSKPKGYPKSDKREPLPYWVDIQADLSLCCSHRSYCRFCRALAHFLLSEDCIFTVFTLNIQTPHLLFILTHLLCKSILLPITWVANSVDPDLRHLILVFTVCSGLSVRILGHFISLPYLSLTLSKSYTQSALYVNLYRAVIGPSG